MDLRRELSAEQEQMLRNEFWAYLRYDASKPELKCEDTFKAFVAGWLFRRNSEQLAIAARQQRV